MHAKLRVKLAAGWSHLLLLCEASCWVKPLTPAMWSQLLGEATYSCYVKPTAVWSHLPLLCEACWVKALTLAVWSHLFLLCEATYSCCVKPLTLAVWSLLGVGVLTRLQLVCVGEEVIKEQTDHMGPPQQTQLLLHIRHGFVKPATNVRHRFMKHVANILHGFTKLTTWLHKACNQWSLCNCMAVIYTYSV